MKTTSVVALAAGIAGAAAIVGVYLSLVSPSSSISTENEKSALTLVPLLMQKPEQMAKQIVEAAGDEIVSLRLNDTDSLRVIAYTTAKGDIILPTDGSEEGYSRIEYWFWTPIARPVSDSDAAGNGSGIWKINAMNFTQAFLEKIGYKLDGYEHYMVEPGGISSINVYQTVSGCEGALHVYETSGDTCIIANQPTRFHFKHDGAWIELRKWYEDIHAKEIRVTEEEARKTAKDYIENERIQNPEIFQAFGIITLDDIRQYVVKETYKDNLVYTVTVSYLNDKTQEEAHCAPYSNFDVFVSVVDGKALGWRPSICY